MAFLNLSEEKAVGLRVKIVAHGEVTVGEIHSFRKKEGKLCLVLPNGEFLLFHKKFVDKVEILKESKSSNDEASKPTDLVSTGNDGVESIKISKVVHQGMVCNVDESDMKKIFSELKPEVPIADHGRGKNLHLNNYHFMNLASSLCGKGGTGEATLVQARDDDGLPYLQLPAPRQTAEDRIDVNGGRVHGGRTQAAVRSAVWWDRAVPPALPAAARLYVVQGPGPLSVAALQRAGRAGLLGLSLEGDLEAGRAAWLALATDTEVFLFDLLSPGREDLLAGLAPLLRSTTTLKVVHDCRKAVALLGGCKLELAGMWDTLAGDAVFCSQRVHPGFVSQYGRSLQHLLTDYLGLCPESLAWPRYRRTRLARDCAVWATRPLAEALLVAAARGALYLPALHRMVRGATMLPLQRAISLLRGEVRERGDYEADLLAHETGRLPQRRLAAILPSYSRTRAPDNECLAYDGSFIHPTQNNVDPDIIFSKDGMHQSRPNYED